MAHYAFLDDNNIVTEVIVGVDDELIEGIDTELWYRTFKGQVCKRTSYNTFGNTHTLGGTPFRGNFAGVGYEYDSNFDAFIPPKPYESWKLNYTTFLWEPPVECPEHINGYIWKWSEHNKQWIKIELTEEI
jgi:hypothetical protein